MQSLSVQVQPFVAWLLRSTLQASMLIGLILLVQITLRGKLGPRWSHAIWLVLLLRMVLPWAPQSRASIFNLIPHSFPQIQTEYAPAQPANENVKSPVGDEKSAEATPVSASGNSPEVTVISGPRQAETSPLKLAFLRAAEVLPLIWLAGAMVLGIYICVSSFSLLRIVRRECPLTDQKILDLVEDCKAEMGIRTVPGVVATDKVRSACLFGFVRPRLLLPKGMVEALSREELRHVFLHELGHLKRHDIWLGWLSSILQALHWFNPLVWLAFYRMRADRELACDAFVLDHTQADESRNYGRTIVNLLERFSQARRLPAMAGILETKSQLKRRITLIAQFKKNSYRWSPLSLALIIILGCISLPDAKRTKVAATTVAPQVNSAGATETTVGMQQLKQSLPNLEESISGTWLFYTTPQGGIENGPNPIYIWNEGSHISYSIWEKDYAVSVSGSIHGGNLKLSGHSVYYGNTISFSASAKVVANTMTGTYDYTGYCVETGKFRAVKGEGKKAKGWVRVVNAEGQYFLDFYLWDLIRDEVSIISVTVSGPNVDSLTMNIGNGNGEQTSASLGGEKPVAGDVYRYIINYSDGTSETVTASVRDTFVDSPKPLSPADGDVVDTLTPTFSWNSPPSGCQGYYRIWVVGNQDNDVWSVYLPKESTSVVYNNDGKGISLQSGETYEWRLIAFDKPIIGGPDNNVWVKTKFSVR